MSYSFSKNFSYKDFLPSTTWEPVAVKNDPYEERLQDSFSRLTFSEEEKSNVRKKCILLSLTSHVIQPSLLTINALTLIILSLSLYPLWRDRGSSSYQLKERTEELITNLARILLTPVILPSFTLAALIGIFDPYNGRKLYGNLERFAYGCGMLAPCFQPSIKSIELRRPDLSQKPQ